MDHAQDMDFELTRALAPHLGVKSVDAAIHTFQYARIDGDWLVHDEVRLSNWKRKSRHIYRVQHLNIPLPAKKLIVQTIDLCIWTSLSGFNFGTLPTRHITMRSALHRY